MEVRNNTHLSLAFRSCFLQIAAAVAVIFIWSQWSWALDSWKLVQLAPTVSEANLDIGSGDLHALIVGISEYKDKRITRLERSHVDAEDLAEFLKTQEKVYKNLHVTLLINEQATRAAVETYLKYKLRKAGKDDTIIVFFSGHGAFDPMYPKDFYFVTWDADPKYVGATAVKMSGLEFVRNLGARRILLIADACHAGGFSFMKYEVTPKSVAPALELFLQEAQQSSGIATIMSAKPGELSWEMPHLRNSVFTHYLLEGLRGKADKDRNRIVTLEEAYQYVYNRTRAETEGAQSPQKGGGDLVGSFPLAYVASPLKLSDLRNILFHAAQSGKLKAVDGLLDEGVPVNSRDRTNKTPLIVAAGKGHTELARLLLKRGAAVDDADNNGESALIHAARTGRKELVELLVSAGAEVNRKSAAGETPLTAAARGGHTAVVALLLDNGAYIRARTGTGNTALSLAAYKGRNDTVKLLLERGAAVNTKDLTERTPLSLAARYGNVEIVKDLLKRGARIEMAKGKARPKGVTRFPLSAENLMRAVIRGDADEVIKLLDEGAPIDTATASGDTPLILAAGLGHAEVVKALLAKGADTGSETTHGSTPLMWASYNGQKETARALLAAGADVNARDYGSSTALIYAAQNGHTGTVELLCACGADVNVRSKQGNTPLILASEEGHTPIVRLLISRGADVNAAKEDGSTALILASRNGRDEIVRLLVEKGADLNAAERGGNTAIIGAAEKGHGEIVSFLANRGADVNARNRRGSTAVIMAAGNGHLGVVRRLLGHGADPRIEDWEGMTAHMFASRGGHKGIAKILKAATEK